MVDVILAEAFQAFIDGKFKLFNNRYHELNCSYYDSCDDCPLDYNTNSVISNCGRQSLLDYLKQYHEELFI